MAYNINEFNGQLLITLADGTANGPQINPGQNICDINLFGKNYPNYGEYQNENFIKLLQNFSGAINPSRPLTGQLWYDSQVGFLKVYNGTAFTKVSGTSISVGTPPTATLGDTWWDSYNYQFKVYNGSAWQVIGPQAGIYDGINSAQLISTFDVSGAPHKLLGLYANSQLVAVVNSDPAFVPNVAITGFGTVATGISLSSTVTGAVFTGTATDSQKLNGLSPTVYARTDIATTFTNNVSVANGALTITSTGGDNSITNTVSGGDFNIFNVVNNQLVRSLYIDGATGLAYVSGDPATSLGVATKNYVDNAVSLANVSLRAYTIDQNSLQNTAVMSAIGSNVAAANSAIVTANIGLQSYVDTLNSARTADITGANTAIVTANIGLKSYVDTLNSARTADITGANSAIVTSNSAMKVYVDAAVSNLGGSTNALSTYVDGLNAAMAANVQAANAAIVTANVGLKAYVDTLNSSRVADITGANTAIVTANSAMKVYVDAAVANLYGNATVQEGAIAGLRANINAANVAMSSLGSTISSTLTGYVTSTDLNSALTLYAPINSPTLTGIPRSVTATTGNSSTMIATTAFVQTAIGNSTSALWQGSKKVVNTQVPQVGVNDGGTNPGDFWFQI